VLRGFGGGGGQALGACREGAGAVAEHGCGRCAGRYGNGVCLRFSPGVEQVCEVLFSQSRVLGKQVAATMGQWPVPSSKGPRKPGIVGHPMFKAIAQSDANRLSGRFSAAGVLPKGPTPPACDPPSSHPCTNARPFHHEFRIQSVFASLGIPQHGNIECKCNASPPAHDSESMLV
jgi:hypothetical protein